MEDLGTIKQQYVESAILSSKALSIGDHKTANKLAKIQSNIFLNIENGRLDKDILVELLNHENIAVKTIAAIDLLRIHHEVKKAEETLTRIASMDESQMGRDERLRVFVAKIQLKSWKENGYVSR